MKKLLALILLAVVLTAGAFATVAANSAYESNNDNDPDPCAVFFSSEPDPKDPFLRLEYMTKICPLSEESPGATKSNNDEESPGGKGRADLSGKRANLNNKREGRSRRGMDGPGQAKSIFAGDEPVNQQQKGATP